MANALHGFHVGAVRDLVGTISNAPTSTAYAYPGNDPIYFESLPGRTRGYRVTRTPPPVPATPPHKRKYKGSKAAKRASRGKRRHAVAAIPLAYGDMMIARARAGGPIDPLRPLTAREERLAKRYRAWCARRHSSRRDDMQWLADHC